MTITYLEQEDLLMPLPRLRKGGDTRKRECLCKRSKHRHGTWQAYQADKCSCPPCRAAWGRYIKLWKHRRSTGPIRVSAVVTVRKLRALARLGWSQREIARELGVKSHSSVRDLMSAQKVSLRTAERVNEVYARLSMEIPPANRHTTRARQRAEGNGWPPPMAYDEESINNPSREVDVEAMRNTRTRRAASGCA